MTTASPIHNRNAEHHSRKVGRHPIFLVVNKDGVGTGATTFNPRAAARKALAVAGHHVHRYSNGTFDMALGQGMCREMVVTKGRDGMSAGLPKMSTGSRP